MNKIVNLVSQQVQQALVDDIAFRMGVTLRAYSTPTDRGREIRTVDFMHLTHQVVRNVVEKAIENYIEEK